MNSFISARVRWLRGELMNVVAFYTSHIYPMMLRCSAKSNAGLLSAFVNIYIHTWTHDEK